MHPSRVTDIADIILVLVRWAIDPERPTGPKDFGPPGLLKRLNGVHENTVPVLGPVALPAFSSLRLRAYLAPIRTSIRLQLAAIQ